MTLRLQCTAARPPARLMCRVLFSKAKQSKGKQQPRLRLQFKIRRLIRPSFAVDGCVLCLALPCLSACLMSSFFIKIELILITSICIVTVLYYRKQQKKKGKLSPTHTYTYATLPPLRCLVSLKSERRCRWYQNCQCDDVGGRRPPSLNASLWFWFERRSSLVYYIILVIGRYMYVCMYYVCM